MHLIIRLIIIEVEIAPVDIVSSDEDQQGNFPTGEQLKFITDNRHQLKRMQMLLSIFLMILPFPVQRMNYRKVNWTIKL